MEEARRVNERLERIEAIQRADASKGALLAEVRALLRDGEAWLGAEKGTATEEPAVGCRRDRAHETRGVGPRS